ncbi:TlpA disulfide reductase family protein [Bdellovibrio sp. HCB274]|uniref:TlpA disulfide reductase family protein n=1 Tax=Bdellovibrio sp. HCB274 TaxID=3394361 RepID=UPI0039B3AC86
MLRAFALLFASIILSAMPLHAAQAEAELKVQLTSLPGESLNQHKVQLKDLKGKIVIVDFWATWCEPCKEALPHYTNLYKKYKSKGLVILAVNEDDDTKTRDSYLKTTPYPFPVFADPGKKYLESFNVVAIPTAFIFDRNQKPITFVRGFDEKKAQVIEKTIKELIEKN